ncbi:MAG: hypothetical protein WKF46_02590 [Candidatus Limnocylindrales bacterium]
MLAQDRVNALGWERPIDLISSGEFEQVRGAALAHVGGDNTTSDAHRGMSR